jgi:two-component system response regulator HupR/HoxA
VDLDLRSFPILVVDDEPDILRSFELSYGDEFNVVTAESGPRGLDVLKSEDVSVIVSDQRMPGMDGSEFLERSMNVRPNAVRIVLTGYTDIDALVRAVNRSRIYRYLSKPWDDEEMRTALTRAVELFQLTRENARLVEELRQANEQLSTENTYLRSAKREPGGIVGDSPGMQQVLAFVDKVAPLSTTVLVQGETGTGKELVARAIHEASPRKGALFVPVNCAALSEGILESELFGHRRGAFTGALADHKGLFEVADGGTLFLDEVSETTPALQAKLLRVLQEGEIRPVGDSRDRKVNVRVVAATNRKLEDEVKAGRFRQDLYYRLVAFPIVIPPLRDRPEDIGPLATHLVRRLVARHGKPAGDPTPETIAALQRYPFKGNVRELENVLVRAYTDAEPGASITEDLLPDEVTAVAAAAARSPLQSRTDGFEREEIVKALERANGVKTHAAAELGITYRGLLKKMGRLGMV